MLDAAPFSRRLQPALGPVQHASRLAEAAHSTLHRTRRLQLALRLAQHTLWLWRSSMLDDALLYAAHASPQAGTARLTTFGKQRTGGCTAPGGSR